MRLSTKGRYGTRAIIEIAKEYGRRPVKRKDIVDAQQVPESYIENILVALKAAGLVRTSRGARGGYQLARDPELITVLDVVEALEGTLVPVYCLEDDEEPCVREAGCPTREIWMEMYRAVRRVLEKYTLKDIIAKQAGEIPIEYTI
ncbi:MAG: RrF2 family transcriptional regulator [Spirochaetota bacterium]